MVIKSIQRRPQILLQLGYPRSGSTVLGEFLGKIPKILHVGEMERLWYPRKNLASLFPQKPCTCSKKLCSCSFWRPYLDKVAEKIGEINSRENISLDSKILCGIKEDLIQKRKLSKPEVEYYTEILFTLYSSLSQGENKIILDSSKELWYAEYLESTNLFDLSYIHLKRDVRGIVYSRQKKLKTVDPASGKVDLNYKYLIYDSIRWNIINKQIGKFLKGKRNIEVKYEEFIKNPKKVIVQVGELLNLKVNPDEIINGNNEFYISENHLVHGNRFGFQRGTIKLNEDTRWMKELKTIDNKAIQALSKIYLPVKI